MTPSKYNPPGPTSEQLRARAVCCVTGCANQATRMFRSPAWVPQEQWFCAGHAAVYTEARYGEPGEPS